MSDLPPGMEDFGTRLEEAAQREIDARPPEPARRRRRRLLRDVGVPLGAALAAAAVSAGAVRMAEDRSGDPIAPEPRGGGALAPARDTSVIQSSAVPSPSGGPPWVVRAFETATGRRCVQVGRLSDGVFGQVQGGRFRALPKSAPGTCASPGATGPLVAVARHASTDLTLVYGVGVDPTAVSIEFGSLKRRVTPAGFGAFVAVFEGARPDRRIVVRSRAGGRPDVQRLG